MQEPASVMNADRRDAEAVDPAAERQPQNGPPQDGRRRGPMKFAYASGSKPLDGYTIKRGIGAGGFGDVYYATSDAGKDVALKRIQRNLDVELRGVSQCLNLKHPNLLALYDIRYDDQDQAWVVMEYVAGDSLQAVIERNPNGLPVAQVMTWFEGIVKGVAYLHDHGIVHRDLKPGNIFMDHAAVKIGDYGLSKFISCSRRSGQTESVGTFHYMAPEIGLGRYGKEIDIYALGILLYEMLTGRVPFEGESSQEIIMKHLTAEPELSRVPAVFRPVIRRAMAKDPTARYRSATELLNVLPGSSNPQPASVEAAAVGGFAAGPAVGAAVGSGQRAGEKIGARLKQVYHQTPPPLRAAGDATVKAAHHAAATANQHLRQDREPISAAIGSVVGSMADRVRRMPLGHQILVNVIVFVMLVINAYWLLPLAISLGMVYAVYFVVWYILFRVVPGPTPPAVAAMHHRAGDSPNAAQRAGFASLADTAAVGQDPAAQAQPQLAPSPPTADPVQVRANAMPPSRKVPKRHARRHQGLSRQHVDDKMRAALENKSFFQRGAELTGSMLMAALVAIVLSTIFGVVGAQTASRGAEVAWDGSVFVWNSIVSIFGAWSILFFGKLWEHTEGDHALRRFSLMVVGMALGGFAWVLGEFLMVPPNYVMIADGWRTANDALFVESMPSLYQVDGTPHPMVASVYFGSLFLVLRWWLFADPLRQRRLSIFSSLVAIALSLLAYSIMPIPRGAMVIITLVIAVQLSATWIPPRKRREFRARLEANAS